MKPNDKPQISKRWWTSEKPRDVKGVELEKALQNAEKALADEKAKGDRESIDACVAALEEVRVAADKTVKKEFDKQEAQRSNRRAREIRGRDPSRDQAARGHQKETRRKCQWRRRG